MILEKSKFVYYCRGRKKVENRQNNRVFQITKSVSNAMDGTL